MTYDDPILKELGGYFKAEEPGLCERAQSWGMAIGLQKVDGLVTSQFLLKTAKDHIEVRITQKQANRRIRDYYATKDETNRSLLGEKNELKSRFMLIGLTDEDKRKIRELTEAMHPDGCQNKVVRKEKSREKTKEKSGEKILQLIDANSSITCSEIALSLDLSGKAIEKIFSCSRQLAVSAA